MGWGPFSPVRRTEANSLFCFELLSFLCAGWTGDRCDEVVTTTTTTTTTTAAPTTTSITPTPEPTGEVPIVTTGMTDNGITCTLKIYCKSLTYLGPVQNHFWITDEKAWIIPSLVSF